MMGTVAPTVKMTTVPIRSKHMNREPQLGCPNWYNHVSAFPGYGRILCPWCQAVYVKTVERIVMEALEVKNHD